MTHSSRAQRYAKQIVAGKIPAANWTKLACQRQLDDLTRWKGKAAPYTFDRAAADGVCAFVECLPHVKGKWANRGELIRLEDWQCFILTTIFGWKRADGLRRFRTSYIEVPRKNAKSTLAAAVALFMLVADGEAGAEVYAAATTRDQARIVFDTAKLMAERESPMREAFGLQVNVHSLSVRETGSSFKPLFAEGKTLDGLNIHCAVIDELHAHRTRAVFDVLAQARGSRSQPLLFLITTAGSDQAGVCYEKRAYVTKLLDRAAQDETYFGIIYTIDDDDDWTDERAWAKANPNLDVSVDRDDMRAMCAEARVMASAANAFITKRTNRWVNASAAWMDMRAWERCGDPSLELEDFAGQPCFIGVDLASSLDIAAVSLLFPGDDGAYTLFGRYYLPEERVESGGNSQYVGWAATGKLIATPGAANDLRLVGRIGQDLLDSMERFRVPMAAFDPWRAVQLRQDLDALGHTVVEVPPGFRHFTEPMKELEALVVSGKLRHDGSPVLTWMMANTIARIDGKDNIQPGKEFPENKIDGVVSAIMALGMALRNEDQPSPYKDRGVVFV